MKKKKGDERRSHGALCALTALDMKEKIPQVLFGGGKLSTRARIQCVVKSTFSETRLVRKYLVFIVFPHVRYGAQKLTLIAPYSGIE